MLLPKIHLAMLTAGVVAFGVFVSGCGRCVAGDVTVNSASDLDQLRGEACVSGNVLVRDSNDIDALDLPELERIDGRLRIENNSSLTALRLPSLRAVGFGLELAENDQLQDLSGLAQVEDLGGLSVSLCRGLTSIALPSLETISEFLSITGNNAAASLSLPSLDSVGGNVLILGNALLPPCQVDGLVAHLQANGLSGSVVVRENGSADLCP